MAGTGQVRKTSTATRPAAARKAAASRPPRPSHLPLGRWLDDFLPLQPAEEKLVAACAEGRPCIIGTLRPDKPSPGNAIRAGLIRFLALGGDTHRPVHENGVIVQGAWIIGRLELMESTVSTGLGLLDSHFDDAIGLLGAQLRGLNLAGSSVSRIEADRMQVSGSVFLRKGFVSRGEVRLLGAVIGGNLSCVGGTFDNVDSDGVPVGAALSADRMRVAGSVFLTEGFSARGEVRLLGVSIGGNLDCIAGRFSNVDGEGAAKGEALSADRANVSGNVSLRKGFRAAGTVRLVGARIGGSLNCTDCVIENVDRLGAPVGMALSADRMKVSGSASLARGFSAKGGVRLVGCDIGGNLSCAGGSFSGTQAEGKAEVVAIAADRINVHGGIFLRDGFNAVGTVRLSSALIGADLSCQNARFRGVSNRPGFPGMALQLQGIRISGALMLRRASITGKLDLTAAQCALLVDDIESWPEGLVLDGFRYAAITSGPTDAASRIAWLEKQNGRYLGSEFCPQPWEQLIRILREMGHTEEAKAIAIAKQRALRKAGRIGNIPEPFSRYPIILGLRSLINDVKNMLISILHLLFGFLAGFGYVPQRILVAMAVLWFAAGCCFNEAGTRGYIGPTAPGLLTNPKISTACGFAGEPKKAIWTECPAMPAEYTSFDGWAYSADLLLPIVDLQQDHDWAPIVADRAGRALDAGVWLRRLMWFEILAGWLASAMFAAVVSGLIKKD